MSDWDELESAMNETVFDTFGETVRVTSGAFDSGDIVGVFDTDRSSVPGAPESMPRPQPAAMLHAADIGSTNLIGGRLQARGVWWPIVRVHDPRDGTLELELGFAQ